MRFASLGSGSKGNATLVEWRDTCLMIDCGFSIRETTQRLAKLGKKPEQISAILVTHEHSDHWKGVVPLAAKYGIDVYVTAGCLKSRKVDSSGFPFRIIDSHTGFTIGDIGVTLVPVPHDAREPVQFVFKSELHQLGILTDVGSLTPHIELHYSACDGLLVEANHDLDIPPVLTRSFFGDATMGSFWLRRNPGGTLLLELSTGEYLAGMLSQQNMAECITKVLFVDAL